MSVHYASKQHTSTVVRQNCMVIIFQIKLCTRNCALFVFTSDYPGLVDLLSYFRNIERRKWGDIWCFSKIHRFNKLPRTLTLVRSNDTSYTQIF